MKISPSLLILSSISFLSHSLFLIFSFLLLSAETETPSQLYLHPFSLQPGAAVLPSHQQRVAIGGAVPSSSAATRGRTNAFQICLGSCVVAATVVVALLAVARSHSIAGTLSLPPSTLLPPSAACRRITPPSSFLLSLWRVHFWSCLGISCVGCETSKEPETSYKLLEH